MKRFVRRWLLATLALLLTAPVGAQERNLLIYCGITMVRPITELARQFEQREGVKISISQGGSEDLYQSLKRSRVGDLYLPGEPSFRTQYVGEGLLGEYKVVGYNQMAFFVQKGNPKKVGSGIREIFRPDLTLILGNAESGSVGKETKTLLDGVGLYPKAVAKAAVLMPDSRGIILAMKRGEGDIALNWRATAFFPDNQPHVDVVELDPKLAKPQALLLNQLTFSKNPEVARRFVNYVASAEGQAVFRKFGFLDNSVTR